MFCAREVDDTPRASETPYVTGYVSDEDAFTVSVSFDDPAGESYVVKFRGVEGIRILDEGDLGAFWRSGSPGSWLLDVLSGGWLDFERSRKDFLSGDLGYSEYLLAGQDECVSVFAWDKPVIEKRSPENSSAPSDA